MLIIHKKSNYDAGFSTIFPNETNEEKELFELLNYAYIGDRYDPEYYITEAELKHLAKQIQKLHELTKKICKKNQKFFY